MTSKRKLTGDTQTLALFENPLAEIYKKPVQVSQMFVHNGVMTGQQLKAWNGLLKNATEQNDIHINSGGDSSRSPLKVFNIPRVKLMELMGYNNTNRKPFKDALKEMQRLTAEWDVLKKDGQNLWASCVLLPFVAIDNEFVSYSFYEPIQPMLFKSTLYSHLNYDIQKKLKSDAAIKLYDWVSRYRTNPSQLTSKEDWVFWRMVVHGEVKADSYLNEYKLFKRDKLLPGIKEINEISDLLVELLEDREGSKRVKKLQFRVKEKPKFPVQNALPVSEGTAFDLKGELTKLGISNHYFNKLKNSFDENIIVANIDYLKARLSETSKDTIKNKGAYLIAACESNYAGNLNKAASVPPKQSAESNVKSILSHINKKRNDDALRMFEEMSIQEQDSLVAKYNSQDIIEDARIPMEQSKRLNRHLIPFYAWLALDTWGQPTPEEIIEFTLQRTL